MATAPTIIDLETRLDPDLRRECVALAGLAPATFALRGEDVHEIDHSVRLRSLAQYHETFAKLDDSFADASPETVAEMLRGLSSDAPGTDISYFVFVAQSYLDHSAGFELRI